MKNNKGLSYFELIVVITIMIILTGVSALSIGYMTRTNATKTADKLVTALTTARSYSFAKGQEKGAFHLRVVGSTYEYAIGSLSDGLTYEQIASTPVKIKYVTADGVERVLNAENSSVLIRFDSSNGSVVSSSPEQTVRTLKIYRRDELVTTVELYQLTGKCQIVSP